MTGTSTGALILFCLVCAGAEAQSGPQVFAGVVAGIATLSADARSGITASGAEASLYKPENGPALNAFVGSHFHEYVTVQANYVWNRNDVLLTAVRTSGSGPSFYEAPRVSIQHAVVGDVLLYFRERRSAIRPYLSTGVGVVRLRTTARGVDRALNVMLPPERSRAHSAVLRVAVGLDVAMGRRWRGRYTFSESLSRNPISEQLSPAGQRRLANFQNLFGVLYLF